MAGAFKKAVKSTARLRLALIGPSGSGKTYTSLAIGSALLPPGKRMAVIDTEHGSASKYSDIFDFDVLELEDFDPRSYIWAIQEAEQAGYGVIVIDSLSHEWQGKGGVLEIVESARTRSKSGNSFAAWKDATPLHNQLIDKMIRCSGHLMATMRSKTEYVLQPTDRGGVAPVKVGMAPIQREGMDFEFDVVGEMDQLHRLIVTKSRCRHLDNQIIDKPGKNVADILDQWLNDGGQPAAAAVAAASESMIADPVPDPAPYRPAPAPAPAPEPIAAPAPLAGAVAAHNAEPEGPDPQGPVTPATLERLQAAIAANGMSEYQVSSMLAKRELEALEQMQEFDALAVARKLEERLSLLPSSAPGTGPSDSAPSGGSSSTTSEPAPDEDSDEYTIPSADRPEAAPTARRKRTTTKAGA